jgi:hypothetical protein
MYVLHEEFGFTNVLFGRGEGSDEYNESISLRKYKDVVKVCQSIQSAIVTES